MVVVVELLFHTYVFAPLATNAIESPKQTTLGPLMLTVGFEFTVKLLVAKACDTHPAVLVPATVKIALLGGLTTALPPCMV